MTHKARAASYRNWSCGKDNQDDFSFDINNVTCPECLDVEWADKTRKIKRPLLCLYQWWRLNGFINIGRNL